jgi:hypothetical protein
MSVDQFLLSADTTDLNYPEIRPTLDLNFARVKALDPRITFTRSSGGSYVGADGLIKYAGVNEARFDHDPSTGESLGLLVEEARTNLLTNTETFDSGWTKFGGSSVTTNATISPDGNQTATKYDYNNSSGVLRRIVGYNPSTTYTVSAFLKAAEIKYLTFLILEKSSIIISMRINLETGEFLAGNQGLPATRTLTYYGNGWYRASITFTTTSDPAAGSYFDFRLSDRWPILGGPLNNPVPGQGIYIWGAQLEVGAFPTSYIPTQASTRTRAADNARIIGKNFSEWYRQDEGTVFVKAQTSVSSGSGTRGMFRLVNSSNTLLRMRVSFGSGIVGVLVSDTTTQANFNMGTYIVDTFYNAILKYGENDFASSLNGATPLTDFSGTVPRDLNLLQIGQDGAAATTILNGTISRLTYFPKRLPNAQLQALTR